MFNSIDDLKILLFSALEVHCFSILLRSISLAWRLEVKPQIWNVNFGHKITNSQKSNISDKCNKKSIFLRAEYLKYQSVTSHYGDM